MVSSATSLTGNGLKDWLIQRVTAIYMLVYVLYFFFFLFTHSPLQYETWYALFHMPMMQIATVLAVFALLLHAWVGIWTVTTDYLKCTVLRLSLQSLVLLLLLGQFVWVIMTLWGQTPWH